MRLVEEIASVRLVLRRTFMLAMDCADLDELVRLNNYYGLGCRRLARLLQVETQGRVKLLHLTQADRDQAHQRTTPGDNLFR
jgi:hypothetical protein